MMGRNGKENFDYGFACPSGSVGGLSCILWSRYGQSQLVSTEPRWQKSIGFKTQNHDKLNRIHYLNLGYNHLDPTEAIY